MESFEVSGHDLSKTASVCVQIVRKLLTFEESNVDVGPQTDNVISSEGDEASSGVEPAPTLATGRPTSANAIKDATWEVVKQEVVPSYVKAVSFTVASNDLNPERRRDLEARFPGVSIVSESSSGDHHDEIEAQFSADQWLQQAYNNETTPVNSGLTTVTKAPQLEISIKAVAEIVPTTPSATPTGPSKPSLLSRMSTSGTETRFKSLASPTSPIDTKMFDRSPILRIAERIGLSASSPGKVIHAIWLQWQNHGEVKPFAAVRKTVKLQQYYNNLVTLYILAFHRKEFDLCFAILLRFQSTNYTFRNELPDLATTVLAFQYLPEDNDLCRWIATLFAFLWGTQHYESREHILADFPQIDNEAFCKFLFAIAYIRDPFTKGHNTAVLAQWCEVHHHNEDDAEYRTCQEVYSHMEDYLDKIRSEEAEHEYDEAKRIVDDYVKSLRSQSLSVDTSQSTPIGMNKRRAESPVVQSHKKYKRGGERGGGRGGFGRASS